MIIDRLVRICRPLCTQPKRNSLRLLLIRTYATTKEVYERKKPASIIATIGDHKHGKTTLSSAITKVLSEKSLATFADWDTFYKSQEEKSKRVSIQSVLLSYQTDKHWYSHLDLPGSLKYFKNMIKEISAADTAIFVISASEGISSHGKDHLKIAKHFGVNNIVVFLNQVDLASEELIEAAEEEVRDIIPSLGYDAERTPIIKGSALAALEGNDEHNTGKESILNLLKALDKISIERNPKDLLEPSLCSVLNAFSVPGSGSVIRGKLDRGTIKKGDQLQVCGYGYQKTDTINGLEIFRKIAEEGHAGDMISIQLKGLRREDIKKGMVAFTPGSYTECNSFEAEFETNNLEEDSTTSKEGKKEKLFSKNWESQSLCLPISENKFMFVLLKPAFVEVGQPLVQLNANRTLSFGKVTKVLPPLSEEERASYFSKQRKKRT